MANIPAAGNIPATTSRTGVSKETAESQTIQGAEQENLSATESAIGPMSPPIVVDAKTVSVLTQWPLSWPNPAAIRQSVSNIRPSINTAILAEQNHGIMFLLLPVALGLGAAIYYSRATEPAWPILVAGLGATLCLAIWQRQRAGHLSVALSLLAVVIIGMLAGRYEAGKATILLDGRVTTTISGRVLAANVDSEGRVRYLLRVLGTSKPVIRRPPAQVRLLARADHQAVQIGAVLEGRAQLTPPSGPAYPGGYNFARNAYGQGIGAYGFFYSAPKSGHAPPQPLRLDQQFGDWISKLRAAISARVRRAVPGDAGALIAALTVSDRGGISAPTVDSLRATGLAHILAISGLHMALVAGTFFISLRKLTAFSPRLIEAFPVKKYAAIGAILISTAYLLISGAGIPTRRAWLMMVVMFGAVIFDRQALTMRNVALAALIIIAISPSSVVTPGFQMSFAATAALIAAYDAWSRRKQTQSAGSAGKMQSDGVVAGVLRFAGGLAMTSLVAGLATGLFAAYHFHQFAAYGLIANLLAMPLVTFVVMPMGLVAMLAMPFALDYWPLQIMGMGLDGVVAIAGYVNEMGGDRITGQLPLWPTILAAGGFVALVFLRTRLRLVAIAPLALGLFLALPQFRQPPPDILVSEDGRLVGLFSDKTISTNAKRPGDFLFSQWQSAYPGKNHRSPVALSKAERASLVDPVELLATLADLAQQNPGRFVCASRATCVAAVRGRLVAALGDPAFMGAGCDLSDILVLAAAIRRDNCYSGAKLVTARHLRQSGALAIRFREDNKDTLPETLSGTRPGSRTRKHRDTAGNMRINAALTGTIRPWTIQRYFDWRSDSFDLPAETAKRAVFAKEDRKRLAKPDTGASEHSVTGAQKTILTKSAKR